MSDFALSHPAFNSYHIDATYDEMLADDGGPRPQYAGLYRQLTELPADELRSRQQAALAFEWRFGETGSCPAGNDEQPHQVERVWIAVPRGHFLGSPVDGSLVHEPFCHHVPVDLPQRVVRHAPRWNESEGRDHVVRPRILELFDGELHLQVT